MTSAKADCIMRFICLMQERLLPTSGEPLLGIRSKRYNKFQFIALITNEIMLKGLIILKFLRRIAV